MTEYVLDSFALTAYIQRETASTRVRELFEEAQVGTTQLFMTTVNLGESLYIIHRRQGANGFVQALNLAADLPIEMVDVDLSLTVSAARIKAVTPIAFGDCYAAALALERNAPVLTGDPDFERLTRLIEVEWLPQDG